MRRRLAADGPPLTRALEDDFARVSVPPRNCELLRDLLVGERVGEGVVADAAFVDGSHRFHEVFVDLYFLRKIVRPGGLVVVDDHCWPSVRTAERYFEKNMGWRAMPGVFAGRTTDQASGEPRLRALRLPDPSFEPAFEDFQPFQ